jgi:hypothetical protein
MVQPEDMRRAAGAFDRVVHDLAQLERPPSGLCVIDHGDVIESSWTVRMISMFDAGARGC